MSCSKFINREREREIGGKNQQFAVFVRKKYEREEKRMWPKRMMELKNERGERKKIVLFYLTFYPFGGSEERNNLGTQEFE